MAGEQIPLEARCVAVADPFDTACVEVPCAALAGYRAGTVDDVVDLV